MIASSEAYPTFFEHLPLAGPLFWLFALLLFGSVLFGAIRLWRGAQSPSSVALFVWLPTVVGCLLAGLQSFKAEICVRANEGGLTYLAHPERYIGHIRIYLGLGLLLSLLLLVIHLASSNHRKRHERSA